VTCTWTIGDDEVCIDDKDIDDLTDVNGIARFDLATGDGMAGLQTESPAVDAVQCVTIKDGYDTLTSTLPVGDFYKCPTDLGGTPAKYTFDLCAYFTVFGEVATGGVPYVGYTMTAEGAGTGAILTPNQPTGDKTDDLGLYALEISKAAIAADDAGNGFFIRLYSPSGVLVWESPEQTATPTEYPCGIQFNMPVDPT